MRLVIDTRAPGTFEDIALRTPASAYTGHRRRAVGGVGSFADRIESTTVGQSVLGAHERYPHDLTSRDMALGTQGEGREGFFPCKFALECLSEPFGGGPVEVFMVDMHTGPPLIEPNSGFSAAKVICGTVDVLSDLFPPRSELLKIVKRLPSPRSTAAPPKGSSAAARSSAGVSTAVSEVSDAPVEIFVDAGAAPMSIATAMQEMRTLVDLPVQDLARLCGISRRHFYNLMTGESAPPATLETRIRALHDRLYKLFGSVGEDSRAARAALLSPLSGGRSAYDIAAGVDLEAIDAAFEELEANLRGGASLRSGALPPSGRLNRRGVDWGEVSESLRVLRGEPLVSVERDESEE